MKTKTLLIAAVMFLGISVAAFAQATYTVSASPVPLAVSSGYAEKVGSVGFSTIPESDVTVTGYIYIKYGGLDIANPVEGGVVTYVKVDTFVDPLANPAGFDQPPTIMPVAIEHDGGNDVLVLTVTPAPANVAARLYSFRVSGVRVDVTIWPATAPLTATIYATENLVTNGEVTTTVLYGAKPAIASFTTGTPVSLSALNGGSGNATLTVTENFRNAFAKYIDDTQSTIQMLKIKFPAVPEGITITMPTTDSAGVWGLCTDVTLCDGNSATVTGDGSDEYVVYRLIQDSNVALVETVVFTPVHVNAVSPEVTLWDTSLALVPEVTVAPLQVELGLSYADYMPRYAADYVAATTLFTWEEQFDNTFLMVPYATTYEMGTGEDRVFYNTGIAISNTTMGGEYDKDDWPMAENLLQGGEIIFRFFDRTEGEFEFRTSSLTAADESLMAGLDSLGRLAAGKTYSVMLTELLLKAGFPEDKFFLGYILVNCKFPYGHGQYFITDFGSFTNGALMLVVDTYGGHRKFWRAESLGN
jgi:hypothetical protein